QLVAVERCVGGGGQRAVAAQLGQERPLGCDAAVGGEVVDGGEALEQRAVVDAALDRQGRLPHLREHDVDREVLGDLGGQAEAVEGGGGHDDGVVVGRLRQAR